MAHDLDRLAGKFPAQCLDPTLQQVQCGRLDQRAADVGGMLLPDDPAMIEVLRRLDLGFHVLILSPYPCL